MHFRLKMAASVTLLHSHIKLVVLNHFSEHRYFETLMTSAACNISVAFRCERLVPLSDISTDGRLYLIIFPPLAWICRCKGGISRSSLLWNYTPKVVEERWGAQLQLQDRICWHVSTYILIMPSFSRQYLRVLEKSCESVKVTSTLNRFVRFVALRKRFEIP